MKNKYVVWLQNKGTWVVSKFENYFEYIILFIFIILLLKERNIFYFILSSNKTILLVLLALVGLFSFVFIRLIKLNLIKVTLSIDSLLTFAALLLTILFFIFQNSLDTQKKLSDIDGVNSYNCLQAKAVSKEITDNSALLLINEHLFVTGIYRTNLPLLREYYSNDTILSWLQTEEQMEEVNNLIALNQQISMLPTDDQTKSEAIKNKNNQILLFASTTIATLCNR